MMMYFVKKIQGIKQYMDYWFGSRILFISMLLLCLGGLFVSTSSKESSWPRLKIKNLPDSAVVIINNNKIQPDLLGYCRVSPGPNTVQIEMNGLPKFAASLVLKNGEEQSIQFECKEKCASVDIVTDPFGASLLLNGSFVGMTPFFSAFLKPGDYSLTVTQKGYEPVHRFIAVSQEKPTMLTLNLEPSKAYQDSIQTVKKTQRKSRQYLQKVLFSSLAAALYSGGVYFNMNAHRKLSQADENAVAYDQARSNFDEYRDRYDNSRNQARKALGARDVLYIAASSCVVGFAVSFLF
jgi:hypothetical protein